MSQPVNPATLGADPVVHADPTPAPDPALCAALRELPDLSAEFSDCLDRAGYRLAAPGSRLTALSQGQRLIGRAITLRYGPERRAAGRLQLEDPGGRLGNAALSRAIRQGDVAVIQSPDLGVSIIGSEASLLLKNHGAIGIVADGAVRDVEGIRALGLPVWAAAQTPVTGRWRLEALEIGGIVTIAGLQVRPGDVVVADDGGVCFVPFDQFEPLAREILEAARQRG